MNKVSILPFILLFFNFSYIINNKLYGVVELFRHGARTPLRYFEEVEELFQPFDSGDITINGLEQLRKLGELIKDKYFISENSENILEHNFMSGNENIKIYSLDIPRCLRSAFSHFQSLFPGALVKFNVNYNSTNILDEESEIWTNIFSIYKPSYINIQVLDPANDTMLAGRECFQLKKIDTLKENFEISDDEKSILIELRNKYPSLIEPILASNFDIIIIKNMLDLIYSTQFHFPDVFKIERKYLRIFERAKLKYSYEYYNVDEEVKLLTSHLFDTILDMFNKLILKTNHNETQMLFFSGRDVNIVDVIRNLVDPLYIKEQINNHFLDEKTANFFIPPFSSHLTL